MSDSSALEELLSSYLHEDWKLFNPDWESAVDMFVELEPALARRVPGQVKEILAQNASEDDIEDRVDELGCGYYPVGGRWREWLTSVAERVERRLAESARPES